MDAATLVLLGRKFEVLTRVRRAYYDYLGRSQEERANAAAVSLLAEGARVTRRQVEESKTRPRSDLLRIEALAAEARIGLARSRANRSAAWKQLAAEVGVPGLAAPAEPEPFGPAPRWDETAVAGRVLGAHTSLKEAAVEAERAR